MSFGRTTKFDVRVLNSFGTRVGARATTTTSAASMGRHSTVCARTLVIFGMPSGIIQLEKILARRLHVFRSLGYSASSGIATLDPFYRYRSKHSLYGCNAFHGTAHSGLRLALALASQTQLGQTPNRVSNAQNAFGRMDKLPSCCTNSHCARCMPASWT